MRKFYIKQFFNNPTASLGIFKCYPWHIKGYCVLIGDSSMYKHFNSFISSHI
ncbi:MAG: hypothetical protein ACJ0QK_05075 [Flavobacteriales bacterium]